jgi:hypothetical protein
VGGRERQHLVTGVTVGEGSETELLHDFGHGGLVLGEPGGTALDGQVFDGGSEPGEVDFGRVGG